MLKNVIEREGGDIKKFLEKQGGQGRKALMRHNLANKYFEKMNDPDYDQEGLKQQFDNAIDQIERASSIRLPDEIGDLGKLSLDDLSPEMAQKVQGTTLMDVRGGGPPPSAEEKAQIIRQTALANNKDSFPAGEKRGSRAIPPELQGSVRQWLMGESYDPSKINLNKWKK